MTNLTQYEKGCSPCAIQRKYGLTYAQGYELAERLRKTQELELENAQLKELLKECLEVLKMVQGETIYFANSVDECVDKINQALGEE